MRKNYLLLCIFAVFVLVLSIDGKGSFGNKYFCTCSWNTPDVVVPSVLTGFGDQTYSSKFATEWVQDIITKDMPKQPEIYGPTRHDNNATLFKYIHDNQKVFDLSGFITTGVDKLYLVLETEKPVATNRGLFIGFDGKSKGALSKKHQDTYLGELETYTFNVYDIDNMYAEGKKINVRNYIKDGKITISGFVGEKGNSIKSISIIRHILRCNDVICKR